MGRICFIVALLVSVSSLAGAVDEASLLRAGFASNHQEPFYRAWTRGHETHVAKSFRASVTVSGGKATLELHAEDAKSKTCSDSFVIATRSRLFFKFFFFHGKHKVHFELDDYEHFDVQKNGVRMFLLKDGVVRTVEDLIHIYKLALGKQSKSTLAENAEFLRSYMNFSFVERPQHLWNIPLKESDIKSGDYMAMTDYDFVNPAVMYLTGGRSGHAGMFLWIDGELFLCEVLDQPNKPDTRIGVIRTPFKEYMKYAQETWCSPETCALAFARLSDDARSRFNETAAVEWFKELEGRQYGFHNVFFTLVDTPHDNFAPPFTEEFIDILFAFMGRHKFAAVTKFYVEGLNKRLGVTGKTMLELYEVMEQRGITFGEAMSIPENDDWVYSDGSNVCCDTFVTTAYRRAGVFGGMDIQATEFTPRDSYMLNIFNATWPATVGCETDVPYCQVIGKYAMDLEGFSSVSPYPHMNERCPTLPPLYKRPHGC